jgi:uncharacterized membrane protein
MKIDLYDNPATLTLKRTQKRSRAVLIAGLVLLVTSPIPIILTQHPLSFIPLFIAILSLLFYALFVRVWQRKIYIALITHNFSPTLYCQTALWKKFKYIAINSQEKKLALFYPPNSLMTYEATAIKSCEMVFTSIKKPKRVSALAIVGYEILGRMFGIKYIGAVAGATETYNSQKGTQNSENTEAFTIKVDTIDMDYPIHYFDMQDVPYNKSPARLAEEWRSRICTIIEP